MNKSKKYISLAIALSSIAFVACGATKEEPIYGDNTESNADVITPEYVSSLNLITPKAYSDAEGLHLAPGSVLSMITPTSSTPYWDSVKKGAMQAIEDLNSALAYTGKERVSLSFNTASNVNDEINILDSELSRYPSAIALAPLDSTAFGMQFDQAMENGIPIITFESATTNSNVSALISTNNEGATLALMSQLETLSDTPDDFFIVTSDKSTMVNSARIDAALSTLPDKAIEDTSGTIIDLSDLESFYETMHYYEHSALEENNNTDTNGQEMETANISYTYSEKDVISFILEQYSDCKNFLILDGDAGETLLSILDTLEVNYEDYNLLSFDTSDILLSAVINSKLDGLLITNPYGIGYSAIIASARAALDMSNEAFVDTGHILIDATDISEGNIQDYLY